MARKSNTGLEQIVGGDATLYEKLIHRFRKPRMSRSQALEARPIRNPALKWEELDSGEVTITLPRRRDAVGKLLQVLFYIPNSRPVNLDVVGANVWKLSDGEHTVNQITDALTEEHKLHRREAEVSLTEFLKTLGKRNMVAFVVPKDALQMPSSGRPSNKDAGAEDDGDKPRSNKRRGRKKR